MRIRVLEIHVRVRSHVEKQRISSRERINKSQSVTNRKYARRNSASLTYRVAEDESLKTSRDLFCARNFCFSNDNVGRNAILKLVHVLCCTFRSRLCKIYNSLFE